VEVSPDDDATLTKTVDKQLFPPNIDENLVNKEVEKENLVNEDVQKVSKVCFIFVLQQYRTHLIILHHLIYFTGGNLQQ
jgi:hypothetical protein